MGQRGVRSQVSVRQLDCISIKVRSNVVGMYIIPGATPHPRTLERSDIDNVEHRKSVGIYISSQMTFTVETSWQALAYYVMGNER